MVSDALLAVLNKNMQFPDDEAKYVLSLFKEKKYKRQALLLQEGKLAQEVFFVVKGSLRLFIHTEEGQERTCNFIFENEFVTDLESFSRQTRATAAIMALEPSTCLTIDCNDLVEALKHSPATAEFFRMIVEEVATDNMRRTKSLLSLSPEKQFDELLQNRPGILQRVPLRYIAQYVGIAPESLSRIRKRRLELKS
ncbi:MAG TPA: Crp/Fnr family transcriptional regulator [Flavihumibacter sp.]|nr:Crp/Fnr family transcriptional regulator [Bacteroidota bacterium]HQD08787.1 Crp/Fnr family transcriptional regulator [Flavihumibacter sp.]